MWFQSNVFKAFLINKAIYAKEDAQLSGCYAIIIQIKLRLGYVPVYVRLRRLRANQSNFLGSTPCPKVSPYRFYNIAKESIQTNYIHRFHKLK